ncbi:MAG TPA: helix-turn-helix domain-containing protein, partial [Streptosporangiaceae bacterium]
MKKFGASGDEAASGGGPARRGGSASGSRSARTPLTPQGPRDQRDPQQTSHVDVLKALADPLRLNILYALTRRRGPDLPARTAKELAAELGEPQTKLYRHIKHLEAAGLIRSVSSRV